MTVIVTLAPAKVNWTLEALARRPDGYHEVRTVLQTIDLADEVRVNPADPSLEGLELSLSGRCEGLAGLPIERNLAYRAAGALRARTGHVGGARIHIEKRIPVGAGLGGGSTDAAAVLRALVALWELEVSPAEMASVAAELGSDVPFFLTGGTALAQGRGEIVTPLPDLPPLPLLLTLPPDPSEEGPVDKTARMYAHLRDEHFTDGSATQRLVDRLSLQQGSGRPLPDDVVNVFDGVAAEVDPRIREAMATAQRAGLTLHLAGAGRGLFCLAPEDGSSKRGAARALTSAGCEVLEASTLPSVKATALRGEGRPSGRGRT